MKQGRFLKVSLLILAVLLMLNLIVSLGKMTTISYAVKNVQYKVVPVRYSQANLQSALDKYSNEGWELATHYSDILIFKK